jgi:hypothetical protein
MTNTRAINAAAGVIHACIQQGKPLPASQAYALEAAGLLNSPEIAAELVLLRARVAVLEAAAYGDAEVRLLSPVEQIRHLHACVAAQMARAETLDRLLREYQAAAGNGSTRTVDEDPIAYSLTEQVADQDQEAGQGGPPCQRCGAPAVSHVAWASGHLYVAPSTPSAVEALHASSGAVIEIPDRPRAAVEEPHDDPVGLHHDYRVPHDLPPAVTP